jgi:hypothetical protein
MMLELNSGQRMHKIKINWGYCPGNVQRRFENDINCNYTAAPATAKAYALCVTSGNHSFALEPLLLKSENDIYFVTV